MRVPDLGSLEWMEVGDAGPGGVDRRLRCHSCGLPYTRLDDVDEEICGAFLDDRLCPA